MPNKCCRITTNNRHSLYVLRYDATRSDNCAVSNGNSLLNYCPSANENVITNVYWRANSVKIRLCVATVICRMLMKVSIENGNICAY